MNKQPSLTKIITIDFAAFAAFIFPLVMWGLYLFLYLTQKLKPGEYVFPALIALITLAAVGVLVWRVRLFNTIYDDGIEIPAVISNIQFFRDRGRVEYVYTYQGQKYLSGNAIHKVRQTQALQIGAEVVLMVDRNNPKRAFISDLYI
jgi:hypothetical protein